MKSERFYGYKHWTLEEVPRCFYVGKGKKGRPFSKLDRNHKWHAIVKRFGLRVEVCLGPVTNEEACAWEVEEILREGTFTTCHSHDCPGDVRCNFTKGGDGKTGWRMSDETKARISAAKKGKSHLSPDEVTREKMRQSMMGKNASMVEQLTLEGVLIKSYASIREAHRQTGIANIGACCRGKVRSVRGYVWRYAHRKRHT